MGSKAITALLLALTALVSIAQAESTVRLAGVLHYHSADLSGEQAVEMSGLAAFNARAEVGRPLTGSWLLDARDLVVNRTYEHRFSAVANPLNPSSYLAGRQMNNGSRESTFLGGRVTTSFESSDARFLLHRGPAGARLTLTATSLHLQPAQREAWHVGPDREGGINVTSGERALDRYYNVIPGQPHARTSAAMAATFEGDFTIVVWGPTVTVTRTDGGLEEFRSGEWTENETAASRDLYRQILELRVRSGNLTWTHQAGLAQWVAHEAVISTTGNVQYEQARGLLAAPGKEFRPGGDALRLVGRIVQRVQSDESPTELSSTLVEARASVSLPPAVVRPQVPVQAIGIPALGLVAIVLLGFAVWFARRWQLRRKEWEDLIGGAVEFVSTRHSRKARRLVGELLRRNPTDREAWMLNATTLWMQRRYRRLFRDIRRAPQTLLEFPPTAWVLSRAYERAGNVQEALKWLEIVARDPTYASLARTAPLYPMLGSTRADTRSAKSDSGRGYA